MKKSHLTLLIASLFALSACDDKNLSQKVLESEKQVVQLEASLKKAEEALNAKEQALSKLQNEMASAQEKLNHSTDVVPALQVEIEPLFNKSKAIKHPKDPKDEFYREQTKVDVFVSTAKTGLAWLDQLLLQELFKTQLSEEEREGLPSNTLIQREQVMAFFQNVFSEYLTDAKEFKPFALQTLLETSYIGQRHHLATFSLNIYDYTGGAHGLGYTHYITVDLNKKAIVRLDDVISPTNQTKLKELLWERYAEDRRDENGNINTFTPKNDFEITPNFYFTPNGIAFEYPVYALGPFAEGPITLELYFAQINSLLNKAYQRTEKDGFGLHSMEF